MHKKVTVLTFLKPGFKFDLVFRPVREMRSLCIAFAEVCQTPSVNLHYIYNIKAPIFHEYILQQFHFSS